MKHYYNTTDQDEKFVKVETNKNKTQEELILDIFKLRGRLTASDVLKYFSTNVPLTSIRRGISNLKGLGVLKITLDTKLGIYGKPEKYYEVSDNQLIMF